MCRKTWLETCWIFIIFYTLLPGSHGNFPPIWEKDMNNHWIREDTPIGTSVYQLKGSDPEGRPVKYSIAGTPKLRVEPYSGIVRVDRVLDREANGTLRLHVILEDDVEGELHNNRVALPISVIILDVNDNPPKFNNAPYETTVPENAVIGTTVFSKISVSDVDVVGDILNVTCQPTPQFVTACRAFRLVVLEDSATNYFGAIVLNTDLDYASKQIYQFKLVAQDGKHEENVPVVIRISDVQNSPPEFKGSLAGLVREDDPVGTLVTQVRAEDGDRGTPRRIVYRLLDTIRNHFSLDADTGRLRTAKPLDREMLAPSTGVITLQVKAIEVVDGKPLDSPQTVATANLTVTIRDVNDEPPRFNEPEFTTFVRENVLDGTALPNLDIQVSDTDIGSNSVFTLSLVDQSGMFAIEPRVASGHASVSIRLKKGPLDYENPNHRKFILLVVAKEKLTSPRLQSTATVTVSVTDVNDNTPSFPQEQYSAVLAETALPGTIVITITAQDRDTGMNGQQGIRYTLLGNGAEKFSVNSKTGVISVALCSQPGSEICLDFETKPIYFLSLQATDEEGSGRSSSVPLRIQLLDSNDNTPAFTHDVYPAVIDEGSDKFEPPLQVKAYDRDKTSELTYSIVEGVGSDLFIINPRRGDIHVKDKSGLDVSGVPGNVITITVQVTDGQFSNTASVRIDVKDANNNAPKFEKETYLVSVQESSPIGTEIERVVASDADIGVNAKILYRLKSGGFDDFRVDDVSGIVSVKGKLDYDTKNSYSMQLLAVDAGIPSLTGTTTLTVSIVDSNDKAPRFIPPTQRAQIAENAKPGQVFYKLKAEDPDVRTPDALRYGIEEPIVAVDKDSKPISNGNQQYKNFFKLNEKTGELSVSSLLDRDIAAWVYITVTVTDTSANVLQVTKGTLQITIVDVNDFPPVFPPPWSPSDPYITINIKEEQPLDSLVYTFTATDKDSNIAEYRLGNETSYFYISPETGELHTASRLDFETVEADKFTLTVYDTGIPQMSASATVIVNVININDEPPVFTQSSYNVTIEENTPNDKLITEVFAVDKDKLPFGEVYYCVQFIDPAEAGERSCNLQSNGKIYVSNYIEMDREVEEHIRVFVKAVDNRNVVKAKSATALVNVYLLDVNDNAPHFAQKHYSASVMENIALIPPTPILQVVATDPDKGENSSLLYTILSGNNDNTFRLDSESGTLYPAKSLQGRLKSWELQVQATDRKGKGLTSNIATITIKVQSVNQYKPKFISPNTANSTISIPENASVANFMVMKVEARDKDSGRNGVITYHFRVGEKNVQQTEEFNLDPITGELRTRKILDREEQSQYHLVLMAKDGGTPISHETLRFLTVKLEDKNDNEPIFRNMPDPYVLTLSEQLAAGSIIGQVRASDMDVGNNARIFYYILEGNDDNYFSLDKSEGIIRSAVVFDREEKEIYDLLIKATNQPNYILEKYKSDEVLYDPQDLSIIRVRVVITDLNDNPPKFSKNVFYAAVPVSADGGHGLTNLEAIDPDRGINGSLSYTVTNAFLFSVNSNESVGAPKPSPFRINKSGKLETATLMAEYKTYWFLLDILVVEDAAPYREATTKVQVWLYTPEQLVRLVLSHPPEEAIAQKDRISSTLSEIVGKTVVIADIRYHIDKEGNLVKDWCDLYVLGVDLEKFSLVPVSDILKALDINYDTLREKYQHFQIRNVLPASLAGAAYIEIDPALAALIALMVVLFVGMITFFVVCCCAHQWTTTTKRGELLVEQKSENADPTSLTENPLWIEQKLKMYEEQELCMQVMNDQEAEQNTTATIHSEYIPDNESNMYATLQRPTLSLGGDIGESSDYATLDRLRENLESPAGPKIPGITPDRRNSIDSHDYHELHTVSDDDDDLPSGMVRNRHGEPELVAELI